MPLPLRVDGRTAFDRNKEEFVYIPDQTLILEHCLLSIARWESKWKKSFITSFNGKNKQIPLVEIFSYFQCMVMNDDFDENFIYCLTREQQEEIFKYMSSEQTATIITHEENTKPRSNEILTSELIYYYMSQVPLPFELCERWHFSRLMKTLEIAGIKSQPEKKMSSRAWGSKQAALNKIRRAKMGSLG